MPSQREKAKRIASIVAERVRQVSTEGLGRWEPTWEIVAVPSDRFMDSLYHWEQSGTRDNLEAVHQSAEALVNSWRVADTKFKVSRLADMKVPA